LLCFVREARRIGVASKPVCSDVRPDQSVVPGAKALGEPDKRLAEVSFASEERVKLCAATFVPLCERSKMRT